MISFRVQIRGWADVRLSKRVLIPIINSGLSAGILWWHRQVLPKHFSTGADRTYRYAKRKGRRVRGRILPADQVKRFRFHHDKPLEEKGLLRRRVGRRISVHARRNRPMVTGRMNGPPYLKPAGRPGRNLAGRPMPDMGAEITRVPEAESTPMIRIARRGITAGLRALRNRRTVRIGR